MIPGARHLAVLLALSYGLSQPVLCLDLGIAFDLLASDQVASSTVHLLHGAAAGEARHGHGHHGGAGGGAGASSGSQAGDPDLQLRAPCPCGCSDAPNVAASRARVGDALQGAPASAPVHSLAARPHIADLSPGTAPVSPVEHIPIPS